MKALSELGRSGRSRAALAAAVIAFVVAQTLGAVHAAEFGDEHHDHGGEACVFALVLSGDNKFFAPTTAVIAISLVFWGVAAIVAQTERAAIAVRAARPRGPPHR